MKNKCEKLLSKLIEPIHNNGYSLLIQPYNEGWLLHLYTSDGEVHRTSVGAATLEEAVEKALKEPIIRDSYSKLYKKSL